MSDPLQLPLPNFDERQVFYFYRIFNTVTGKTYVGITLDFNARIIKHLSDLKLGKHHSPHLQNSFNKNGEGVFQYEIIERVLLTYDEAYKKEVEVIANFDSFENGYNCNPGGAGGNCVPVMWEGIEYSSITELAKALDMPYPTVSNRVRKGYKCEADVKGTGNATACVWNGEIFNSYTEAGAANGVSWSAIKKRVLKGYSDDADVTPNKVPVVWGGIEYESLTACAAALGIDRSTLKDRLALGYTKDSDITHATKAKPCIWGNVEYPSISQAAKANGVPSGNLCLWLSKGYKSFDDIPNYKPKK